MGRQIWLVVASLAAIGAIFNGKLPDWSGLLDFGLFLVFVAVVYWLMGPTRAEKALEQERRSSQQERE